MEIKIVIIEDEESAQKHLTKLLEIIEPSFSILARLPSIEEAVQWFKNNAQPELVFMDIHLSDGISFEILGEIDLQCPIIYTTAYDTYAIKAFTTTGISYLLKPITKEDLESAIAKYKNLKNNTSDDWLLKNMELLSNYTRNTNSIYSERFLLKSGKDFIPVKTKEIAYFYRDEIVFAKTFNGQVYGMDPSLNQLQKIVNPQQFVRLNRQLLAHINAIKKMNTFKPGQLQIEIDPPYFEPIYLSQERSSWLKAFLNK